MVSDEALLKMIMEKHPDQDAEFIVGQFDIYKKMLLHVGTATVENPMEAVCAEETPAAPVEETKKKRITKRSLKVKPETAIQDDQILCCVCGNTYKSLTATHLKAHGLTPEEYRKVCGYPADQSLMSRNNLVKVRAAVQEAQKVRKTQKSAKQKNEM